jgi:hypothetical protein
MQELLYTQSTAFEALSTRSKFDLTIATAMKKGLNAGAGAAPRECPFDLVSPQLPHFALHNGAGLLA